MENNFNFAVDVSITEIKDEIIDEPITEDFDEDNMGIGFTESDILILKSYNCPLQLNNLVEKSKNVDSYTDFNNAEISSSQLTLEEELFKGKTISLENEPITQKNDELSKKTATIDEVIISYLKTDSAESSITKPEDIIKTNDMVKRKLDFEDENTIIMFKKIPELAAVPDNQVLQNDNEDCSNRVNEKNSCEPKNNVELKIDTKPKLTTNKKQVFDTVNEKGSTSKPLDEKCKSETEVPKMNEKLKFVKNGFRDLEADIKPCCMLKSPKQIPETNKNAVTEPIEHELKKKLQNLTAFKVIDFNHQTLLTINNNGQNTIYDDIKLQSKTTVELYDWSDILKNSPRYCTLCKTLFATSEELNKHIINWHDNVFYCKYCQVTLDTKTRLEMHLEIHAAAQELVAKHSRKGPKPISCFICRVRLKSKSALDAHVRSHKVTLRCNCENEPISEVQKKN